MKTILSLAVLIITLFIISTTSFAVVFTVTNLDDSGVGSLRQAIIDANASMVDPVDEIVFMAGVMGTITLSTGEMAITDDLTITGPGADVITIDADNSSRIFNINDSTGTEIVVSISGLMFINGSAGSGGAILNNEEALSIDSCVFDSNSADFGGAILNFGTVTAITNSTFSGNSATSFGGAILNDTQIDNITNSTFSGNSATNDGGAIRNSGTIDEITNSTFSGNSANSEGGAIFNVGFIDNITNSTFNGNSALDGGAIFNVGFIENITNSTFSGNSADFGGAILNDGTGTIDEITNSTFSGNDASFGGAILNDVTGTIDEITNSTFSGNSADVSGGAISNDGTVTAITNSTFSGNSAVAQGGAIANFDTITAITNSTFSGNSAGFSSGAIFNGGTITAITNSTFSGNSANLSGGAIANSDTITEITNSTFSGNSADVSGGAIFNSDTIIEITNSTFSGNSAALFGGAIFNSGDMNISFTTIANNEADEGGGIFEVGAASINIRNSIVAFNTATTSGPNCNGDIATTGNETNNYSNDASCGFDFNNANILLDPLADNGGPTQTLALLGGDPLDGASALCDPLNSVGVATGVPLPNDQRFFPRPFGPECDSGAYENGPSASVRIKKVTDPPGGTGFDFTTTGFEELVGCSLQGDAGEFVMDHKDSRSCAVPFGDYTITEDIPDGQVLNIFCTEILPPGSVIDNDTGELSFSIISSLFNVNCLFINVTAQTLLNAMDEPPGMNCEFGGVKIETGLDTNLNGVLDPDEVLSTFYVCDGAPGDEGPEGPEGEEGLEALIKTTTEPPGPNCEFGGQKIEIGLDLNRNGVLDPNEVEDIFYLCNGAPGEDGENTKSCSLAPVNSISGPSTLAGLLIYMLIPVAIVVRRRFRRK